MNTTAAHAFSDVPRLPLGYTTPDQLAAPGVHLGAYLHNGNLTCPYCTAGRVVHDFTLGVDDFEPILDALLVKPLEEAGHVIDYAVELLLDTLAKAISVDRSRPGTFSDHDFPKIVLHDWIDTFRPDYDACENCGADYL